MKVILGLRGTKYFYADKDGKKTVNTLEPKALRGIMNDAMCMSNFELGIADDHEGIIILDESDPARRRVRLHRAEAALRSEWVLVPLASVPVSCRMRPGLHGAAIDLGGRLVLEDAWVDP